VYAGAARGRAESLDVENAQGFVIAISSVFGSATLMIAAFVIASTVGLSVRQRQRDIALLRALAATPRQVRRMVIRETAAIGAAASAAGIWPGLVAVGWLRGQLVTRGMVPPDFRTELSWVPPLVAAAAALLAAVAAAWIASLRASRIRPTEALTESTVERASSGLGRPALGLLALAGGATLCVLSESVNAANAPAIALGTVFVLAVAVALLSPLLIRASAGTFGRALRLTGITGRLAAANAAASARRLSAVVSSLVLAVALSGSLWFVLGSAEHVAGQQASAGLLASTIITPPPPGLPAGIATTVARDDGVIAASGVVRSSMLALQDSNVAAVTAQGLQPAALSRTVDLEVTGGTLAALHGNTVAVDALTAQGLHLSVGSWFRGWFGDGAPARLRVVAIYARGLGFAQMTLPHALLLAHTTTQMDSAAFVATRAGDQEANRVLRPQLARLAPGASALPRQAYQVSLDQNLVQNAWADRVLVGVLVIYVAIAAANTLIMYALDRGRELAALRLAGTTRRQLIGMVRLEQALLLGLVLTLGVAIAAATLIPMVTGITGSSTPYIPLSEGIAVTGGVILLSYLATAIPIRRLLKIPPVQAISSRE
jgi:putative ABC transport system permease protein